MFIAYGVRGVCTCLFCKRRRVTHSSFVFEHDITHLALIVEQIDMAEAVRGMKFVVLVRLYMTSRENTQGHRPLSTMKPETTKIRRDTPRSTCHDTITSRRSASSHVVCQTHAYSLTRTIMPKSPIRLRLLLEATRYLGFYVKVFNIALNALGGGFPISNTYSQLHIFSCYNRSSSPEHRNTFSKNKPTFILPFELNEYTSEH